ncbi:MAG: ArnT family glycosyltransferase [Candidatus Nanohaloarchaea archaeon]
MNSDEVTEDIKELIGDRYFIVLLAILGIATFLRFKYAFFQGMFVDEGRYARIGTEISKHLISYSVDPRWHGQITKFPPLYPYLIALSTYIFGKTETAVRVVSPIMGVIGVGVSYLVGKHFRNREVGLMAAAMMAVNPIFWFLSERILIGATFTVVYSATILLMYLGMNDDYRYSRYALWATGPVAALTLITKQPAYSLGVALPLYFLTVKRNEIRELVMEDISFRKSRFYETLTDRDYYISAGLGVLTISPWMLRSFAVCGSPLCGLSRALAFTSKSPNPVLISVQETLYYLKTMPQILTGLVTLFVVLRVGSYIWRYIDENPDYLIKFTVLFIAAVTAVNLIDFRFAPFVILTLISLLARRNAEKLSWIWIGVGIGFMSVTAVKNFRYIVFTLPALVTVAGIQIWRTSEWISGHISVEKLKPWMIAAVIMLPILFTSYNSGVVRAAAGSPGSAPLDPAGTWFQKNTPRNTTIAASSPAVMRYYAYPRMAFRAPDNSSKWSSFIREHGIDYLVVDTYERTQPRWLQKGVPPYRLPNRLRAILARDGRLSSKEVRAVAASFQRSIRDTTNVRRSLVPVKSIGKVRMPLGNALTTGNRSFFTSKTQPAVRIYRVNRSALS